MALRIEYAYSGHYNKRLGRYIWLWTTIARSKFDKPKDYIRKAYLYKLVPGRKRKLRVKK